MLYDILYLQKVILKLQRVLVTPFVFGESIRFVTFSAMFDKSQEFDQ